MTKKHFHILADILRTTRPVWGTPSYDMRMEDWKRIRADIARMCGDVNPRFDISRFEAATEKEQT